MHMKVKQHAQSSMRAAIGELELDQILHDRVHLNKSIRSTVQVGGWIKGVGWGGGAVSSLMFFKWT